MLQPDLFAPVAAPEEPVRVEQRPGDLSGLLDRLTATCERPRYNYMLLTLIAEASAETGKAGPFVRIDGEQVAIRDWLCHAMNPVGRREPRRLSMTARVREDLAATAGLPSDEQAAAVAVDAEVRARLRRSGRTNVSRAVSELVRAGLLQRYYQGDYVDHHNRGGQRHAVYIVEEATRRALVPSRGHLGTGESRRGSDRAVPTEPERSGRRLRGSNRTGDLYRLIDDVARCRLLYPAPTIAAPRILVLDIPVVSRGPGLALDRYYPMLIETDEELAEAEEFLMTPQPEAVRPDLLEWRASSIRTPGIVITRYEPPQPAWPWVLTCRWPADLAAVAARSGVEMARGCYTTEMFEEEAALECHMVRLLDSLRQHRPVELKFVATDRLSSAGSA